jgi:hypothetical protein
MHHLRKSQFVLVVGLLLLLAACSGQSEPSTADQGTEGAPAATQADEASAPAPALKMRSQEASKPAAAPMVLPEGTTLRVRLDQSVGSEISHAGDSFAASVAEPVTSNGKVVIPRGARVSGVVSSAKPLGRFAGEATLSLKLTSIAVGGREYELQTAAYTQVKKGKGKRTAVAAGGGAGVGALIGGIVGGGKGAAIGAAAGAGAGTAGSAMTGNEEIVLPAETAVSFRLTQPVQFR